MAKQVKKSTKKPAPKKAAPAKKPAPKKAAPAKKPAPKKAAPAKKPAPKKAAPAKKPAPRKAKAAASSAVNIKCFRISTDHVQVHTNAILVSQANGAVTVQHKVPRSSKMMTRVVPYKDILYFGGGKPGDEVEIHFRGGFRDLPAVELWADAGTVKSVDNGILTYVNEDGGEVLVNLDFGSGYLFSITGDGDAVAADDEDEDDEDEEEGDEEEGDEDEDDEDEDDEEEDDEEEEEDDEEEDDEEEDDEDWEE